MLKNFIQEDSGAVTVDWVVLTAALVGLGLAVMAVVGEGISDVSNNIADDLGSATAADWSTIITRTGSGG